MLLTGHGDRQDALAMQAGEANRQDADHEEPRHTGSAASYSGFRGR
jgi:hypothetical protein